MEHRPVKKSQTCILLGLMALIYSSFALASELVGGKVVMYLEDPGQFEVLHSRAQTTNTGIAFFGLMGWAVEEGARSSADQEREAEIQGSIPDGVCYQQVILALEETLGRYNYSLTVERSPAGDPVADGYVIRLKIKRCGFRLINTTTDELAAFFTARYQILQPGEPKRSGMDDLMITGSNLQHWNDLVIAPELAALEFQNVKIKAGKRLANKLVYGE